MIIKNRVILSTVIFGLFGFFISLAYAEKLDPDLTEMQDRLNEQVMSQPFNVEDEAKIEAYIQQATKKGIKPQTTPSSYWRPGYTCYNIRRYSWRDYRSCRYYYNYYGRYWY